MNSEVFSDFNNYMHVKRPIQNKLEKALMNLKYKEKGIILLVGSVGDGKSHLLSYFNKKEPNLLQDVKIHNDATESNNPYKTAVETLASELENYHKEITKKLVIAINIGMLHNLKEFLIREQVEMDVINTIKNSDIFSTDGMKEDLYEDNEITIVSFINEKTNEISEGEIKNRFISDIFRKIFGETNQNPFYRAFIEDEGFSRKEAIYINYKLMLDKNVQKTVIHLLNKIQIENKRILSTRSLLNFIYDIIVPEGIERENDSMLVNLLFNNLDKSQILNSISQHDPVLFQDSKIDVLNIELYNALDLQSKCKEIFGEETYLKVSDYLYLIEGLAHNRKFEIILRLDYLFNHEKYEPSIFREYVYLLENLPKNIKLKKDFVNKILITINNWKGSAKSGFIYTESLKPETNLRIGLKFNPKLKNIKITNKLTLEVEFNIQENIYFLEVDYNLYKLMDKVEKGYLLKAQDIQETVIFSEFIDNVVNDLESTDETLINIPNANDTFVIREGFIGYEIERV
ncbi:DNA phosphorothioation-dependent restriction protein DptF [Staphylococcus schleiferi]|uniref:DNA phosphorothioation-dependent restriction protein DptF n=1 Tax=Staphylococcus schleiferi TaxID=1295 RepID=UPI00247FDAD2|nr:DNA phosphorothioation-dependent restriction protein DptF [Staphylococcus schleiferi]